MPKNGLSSSKTATISLHIDLYLIKLSNFWKSEIVWNLVELKDSLEEKAPLVDFLAKVFLRAMSKFKEGEKEHKGTTKHKGRLH